MYKYAVTSLFVHSTYYLLYEKQQSVHLIGGPPAMFDNLRALAIRQLHALDSSIRIVVIHPNYAHQYVVLSEFMSSNAAYVRFSGRKLDMDTLTVQVAQTLQNLDGTLDYGASQDIILDECDRAQPQAFDDMLLRLMQDYPNSRFIIFSRQIPECILQNGTLRAQSSFIPNDASFMLWDYALQDPAIKLLEVRAFGEGQVLLNGQPIDTWDGVLPRSLFFYLVDRGMTTRNEIFETFWPNLPTKEATNVFHVTKRKISEVLGIDLTTYWSGFYRISSDIQLSYDVILFTEMVQNSAVARPGEAEELLNCAISLYQGSFLSGMDMEWAKRRRAELAMDYADALATLAKTKEDSSHTHEALSLYLRAASNSHDREDLAISIMQLYRNHNMHQDALAVFERLKRQLREHLGVSPAPQLQELADTIRQEASQ